MTCSKARIWSWSVNLDLEEISEANSQILQRRKTKIYEGQVGLPKATQEVNLRYESQMQDLGLQSQDSFLQSAVLLRLKIQHSCLLFKMNIFIFLHHPELQRPGGWKICLPSSTKEVQLSLSQAPCLYIPQHPDCVIQKGKCEVNAPECHYCFMLLSGKIGFF